MGSGRGVAVGSGVTVAVEVSDRDASADVLGVGKSSAVSPPQAIANADAAVMQIMESTERISFGTGSARDTSAKRSECIAHRKVRLNGATL